MVRRRQPHLDPSLPGRPKSYKVDGRPYNGREVVSAQHPYTPVYCQVRGNADLVPLVVLQLDDELYKRSQKQIPVHLVGHCPRCGEGWQIKGETFNITVDYLDKPVPLQIPAPNMETGEVTMQTRAQTVNVSVEGVRTCPGDEGAGKGICGFRFRIQDNVLIAER